MEGRGSMEKQEGQKRGPIVEGWTALEGGKPHLVGNQCQSCGDYFFPKVYACRNPQCMSNDLKQVPLSREGKLWSFTVGYYEPPPPFRALGTFTPYGLAVVELLKEKMMVMGQVASGVDMENLKVGMNMEIVLEPLQKDSEGKEIIIWKWRPVKG